MAMPLDAELARRLAGGRRRGRCATRTSAPASPRATLVDWGKLSARQVAQREARRGRRLHRRQRGLPDARRRGKTSTAAARRGRPSTPIARAPMMDTYRQRRRRARLLAHAAGAARRRRARRSRAPSTRRSRSPPQPYRAQVRVLDMGAIFTPGGRYRDAMDVGGQRHDRARGRRHPPQRGGRRARRRRGRCAPSGKTSRASVLGELRVGAEDAGGALLARRFASYCVGITSKRLSLHFQPPDTFFVHLPALPCA